MAALQAPLVLLPLPLSRSRVVPVLQEGAGTGVFHTLTLFGNSLLGQSLEAEGAVDMTTVSGSHVSVHCSPLPQPPLLEQPDLREISPAHRRATGIVSVARTPATAAWSPIRWPSSTYASLLPCRHRIVKPSSGWRPRNAHPTGAVFGVAPALLMTRCHSYSPALP